VPGPPDTCQVTELTVGRKRAARPRPGRALPSPALAARALRFEQEVLPHLARVYTAALCLAGDAVEAENLVVETFVRAYAAFLQREPVTGPQGPEAWLYRILSGASREQRPLAWPAEATRWTPDCAVGRALAELPEDLRFAVHLADVKGLSRREIAEITGTSAAVVATRLRDGRRWMRHRLGHRLLSRLADQER
jgi:RNA polymerase sigma-70 factor, ECF subfamily